MRNDDGKWEGKHEKLEGCAEYSCQYGVAGKIGI